MLQELNLNYDLIRLDPFKGEQNKPQILKLNPDGKVPILIHHNKVLLESLAIMEYLHSIVPQSTLIPDDPQQSYLFRRNLHYGLTEIEPYLWLAEQANGPLSKSFNWPKSVYDESIKRAAHACNVVSSFITRSDYLLDSGFSMADIYYYHILTWAMQHGIKHEPGMNQYLALLEQRHAFPDEMYWAHKN